MKKVSFFLICLIFSGAIIAQAVDSIYFHLYTDSLKKGQHNYINVDGKLSNGQWMPLTAKDIHLSCSTAEFEGNELVIPWNFKEEKVMVKVVLKSNPLIWKERTIWIKKNPDNERLPTKEEILKGMKPKKNKGKPLP